MQRSPGLGLNLTPFLDATTSIATSVAAAEQARQNRKAAEAAAAAARASGNTSMTTVQRRVAPIVIVGGIAVIGLGAWFLFGRRKGRGRR